MLASATIFPVLLGIAAPVSAQAVDDFVWVTNGASNTVSKVSKSVGAVVATIPVGINPHGIAVDPDFVWVTNVGSGTVSKIDKSTSSVVATIPAGLSPVGIAVDPDFAWVADPGLDILLKIDKSINAVTAIIDMSGVKRDITGVAVDESFVWVAGTFLISKIDKSTNAVIATISTFTAVYTPFGITNDNSHVWAGGLKIDKASNTISSRMSVFQGQSHVGHAVDENFVWFVNDPAVRGFEGPGDLFKVDKFSDTIVQTVALDSASYGVSLDGDSAWVTHNCFIHPARPNFCRNTLWRISRNTGEVLAIIPVGENPFMFGDGTGFAYDFFFALTIGPPASVMLSPKADTNQVDTEHCVTATVKDASGSPTPGVTVVFSVTGSNGPKDSTAVTETGGNAKFCYIGRLFGIDIIDAFADANNNGNQDPSEPFDAATKAWTLPPSTVLCSVSITEGGQITAQNGDPATFGGNARVSDQGQPSGQQQYQDHGPAQPARVKSASVLSVLCVFTDVGGSATIFGEATLDGSGSHAYRIDMVDQGEPGTGDKYGILLDVPYASGLQTLEAGNVQVHKERS